jgi:membrane protease YdiL (CAAX protease family)
MATKVFPQDNPERLAFLALVVTVSICEEVIYRGFAQRVFEDLSGGVIAVGIVGSAALFALAHLYQGRRGLISTLLIGALFSWVRAWTGSLIPPVVAHFVADLTAGFLAPARLRTVAARSEEPVAGAKSGE